MQNDHKRILVVGVGAVGLEVARQLTARGEYVQLVDDLNADVGKAHAMGFSVKQVNLQNDEELQKLGIGSSVDVLFALLEDDASNVFLVISARTLDAGISIVSIGGTADTIKRLHAAGATKVIDPFRISGYKIFEHMRRPLIAETLERTVFGDVNLDIVEILVTENSFLVGKCLHQLALEGRYNLIVLGVVDRHYGDHLIFATDPKKHRIDKNDILVVIGPEEAIEKLHHDLETERARQN